MRETFHDLVLQDFVVVARVTIADKHPRLERALNLNQPLPNFCHEFGAPIGSAQLVRRRAEPGAIVFGSDYLGRSGLALTTQFANPPIVELIAEVHWPFSGSKEIQDAPAGSTFSLGTPQTDVDAFLARFGVAVLKLGYTNAERLVPQGVPSAPGQPVYRYRSPAHEGIFIQSGWVVATVNAIPPQYKSWTNFTPRVKELLHALTEARADDVEPYYHASIRYVDAFDASWLNGKSPSAFARDVLGFGVSLPEAIESHRDAADAPQAAIQLAFPTRNGMRARVTVGEGIANGNQALIYDTLLGIGDPVDASPDAVFAKLDEAHSIVHEMFEAVTRPIRAQMRPIEDPADA